MNCEHNNTITNECSDCNDQELFDCFLKDLLKGVKFTQPVPYDQMINLIGECRFIISDSGGIQEEAAFLKKPCIVCRKETERSEGIDNFSILCKSPNKLQHIFKKAKTLKMHGACPYGNGKSCDKILKILNQIGLGAS